MLRSTLALNRQMKTTPFRPRSTLTPQPKGGSTLDGGPELTDSLRPPCMFRHPVQSTSRRFGTTERFGDAQGLSVGPVRNSREGRESCISGTLRRSSRLGLGAGITWTRCGPGCCKWTHPEGLWLWRPDRATVSRDFLRRSCSQSSISSWATTSHQRCRAAGAPLRHQP